MARLRENECIGAFVTFNHRQSFLRAVARYSGSTSLFGRLFQPRHLRLRERKPLRVIPAAVRARAPRSPGLCAMAGE